MISANDRFLGGAELVPDGRPVDDLVPDRFLKKEKHFLMNPMVMVQPGAETIPVVSKMGRSVKAAEDKSGYVEGGKEVCMRRRSW